MPELAELISRLFPDSRAFRVEDATPGNEGFHMNFDQLVSLCRETHAALHARAARVVHATLAARNWLFGWYIVEFEQNGGDRAAYGAATLKSLAVVLKDRLGKGFSVDALEQMRRFYLVYPSFIEPWMKSGALSRISGPQLISGTLSRKSHQPAGSDQSLVESGLVFPCTRPLRPLRRRLLERFPKDTAEADARFSEIWDFDKAYPINGSWLTYFAETTAQAMIRRDSSTVDGHVA